MHVVMLVVFLLLPLTTWAQPPAARCPTCPCVTIQGVQLTRTDYQLIASLHLKSYTNWAERSAAINQRYAELYVQRPDRFKWAGLAAFAGLEIEKKLKQISVAYQAVADFRSGLTSAQCAALEQILGSIRSSWETLIIMSDPYQVERLTTLLAKGNGLVYQDAGWMHEAYLDGGIATLGRLLNAEPLQDPLKTALIAAWKNIDSSNPEKVWEGTLGFLEYEQKLLQGEIYDRDPSLWKGLTLSFLLKEPFTKTYFPGTSLADYPQRWGWLTTTVVPQWKVLDASGCQQVVATFAQEGIIVSKACPSIPDTIAPVAPSPGFRGLRIQ